MTIKDYLSEKLHTLAGLALGTVALAACLSPLPALAQTQTAAPAAPAPAVAGHPEMWVAKGPAGTVYMLGSFHLLKPGTNWQDDRVAKAMAASDHIWFEVADFDDQALAQSLVFKYGVYSAPELSQHLTPDETAKLTAALTRHGMTIDSIQRFKPWLVAIVLVQKSAVDAGFDAAGGVDLTLFRQAKAAGKTVTGFENLDFQFNLLAHLDDKDGLSFLDATLKDDSEGTAKLNTMADAWLKGDEAVMTREVVTTLQKETPDLYQKMLVSRNTAWLPQVEALLKAPGTSFVVVGDGHMLGADGLVARLKADGMTVERLN